MAENIRNNTEAKEPGKSQSALAMAVRSAIKQSEEKNAQWTQVKKDELAITVERKGHLKLNCSQASKPPPAPCSVCKDHTGEETTLRGVGPRGQLSRFTHPARHPGV